jgi:hypothetical protein
MREVARVLRPGGVAALGTGNALSWAAARAAGAGVLPLRRPHATSASVAAERALGRAAGFERVECHTHGFAFLDAREMRGHWYKPVLKLLQAPLSPLATAAGAGHRLVMVFHKAEQRGA